ncbi:MAG: hypothetical protein Q8Q12_19135 [bacterium]|nr:hypothetical protein [bacterium]
MKRLHSVSASLLLTLAGISPAGVSSQEEGVVDIGSRLELFVDRFLIDEMSNVQLRLHPPQLASSVNQPFCAYSTVIKNGDIYRMYYRSGVSGYDGDPRETYCYAESRDGVHWTTPDLGIHEINGNRSNNAIMANTPWVAHNFTPFLDTRPGVATDERYKALAGVHKGGGLFAFVSDDGIHWKKLRDEPVIRSSDFAFDSQNVSFWSEGEGCYVCYFRTWNTPHGRLRTISRITSPDFVNWTEALPMNPNKPGEHLYTNGTHPYFRAAHIYIALPTRFLPDRGDSTDIVFMTTRGGNRCDRTFLEAFIRPGLDPERWGNRANYAALNVVPTGPAEMSIYVRDMRYILRTDGFVSINASFAGGEMVTKPIRFKGKELVVNFSTSASGSIRVEAQTPAGEPIPGYALADCPEIIGDAIERVVSWRSGSDLSRLSGQPVRLRFVMKDADLCSLRFR